MPTWRQKEQEEYWINKAKKENHKTIHIDLALPLARFFFYENGEFVERTTRDLFKDKRVVLFGLPGAFTPTCSSSQVPDYEAAYDDLIAAGVDEVYCISMNDAFVMNAWKESLGISKVKFIPDGNGYFTRQLGMNVFKTNGGLGVRSWRYSSIINSEVFEVLFSEEGQIDNCKNDPYENSKPNKILRYLENVPRVNLNEFEAGPGDADLFEQLDLLERDIYMSRKNLFK